MAHKLRFAFAMIAMAFVSIIAYITLHETGHALVAALCGAENIQISIIRAHTWWTGGSFTAETLALCHAAGAALPVCVSCVGMLFYSEDCKSLAYQMAYPYFVVIATGSVIVWVLFPICSMFTPLPNDTEDAAKFLQSSGISPISVSLASVVLILFSIFIAKRKHVFHVLIQMIKHIGKDGTDSGTYVSNRAMAGFAAAVLIAIFTAVLPELPDILTKPIVSLAVTDEIPETATQRTFEIQQDKEYYFQIRLDVQGLLVDLRILDSEQKPVYQMLAGQASANGTINLTPGTYTLSVTYLTDADMFECYCSAMGYSFDDADRKDFRSVYKQEAQLSQLLFMVK